MDRFEADMHSVLLAQPKIYIPVWIDLKYINRRQKLFFLHDLHSSMDRFEAKDIPSDYQAEKYLHSSMDRFEVLKERQPREKQQYLHSSMDRFEEMN